MASIRFLPMPRFRAFDANGDPASGFKVFIYEAGTSTPITTWQDANQSGANTNPVILDSEGYADIFFDQNAKIVLKDADDVQQWSLDNVSPVTDQEVTGKFNIVDNGSFELDGNGDGIPDEWTVALFDNNTSTVELDTSQVLDGTQSLKFVSQGDGGGTATSSVFGVPNGSNVSISFYIRSSVADVRNIVEIEYLDKNGSTVSTATVYDEDTSNPTSFTQQFFTDVVPGVATQARMKLTGCDESDATSGTTWFDFVQVNIQGYAFTGTGGEVTASASELNYLDGYNGSTAELNDTLDTIQAGIVQMYAGSSEPSGWLFCNGQEVSRTTYADLFNVVSTTYGNGDGSTTFNVPDLRDRSPLGAGTMGTTDANRVTNYNTSLGNSGGADEHTITNAESDSHNHGGGGNTGNRTPPVEWKRKSGIGGGTEQEYVPSTTDGSGDGPDTDWPNTPDLRTQSHNHSYNIPSQGGDSAHNNMHPFLAINFIIKT